MTLAKDLLDELKQEAAVTRKYLASVPFNKEDYKPHEKSESLGRLAIHVAEIVAWWKECLEHEELDFIDFEPKEIHSTQELLTYFDELLAGAEKALLVAEETVFEEKWSMKYGDIVYFNLPQKQVLRTFCMNHWVHHRAQLGVYLRLLGIDVPATYGPSADDEEVTLIAPYSL